MDTDEENEPLKKKPGYGKWACGHKTPKLEPLQCWVCLLAACFLNFSVTFQQMAFGVQYGHLMDRYNSGRATVGWIFSVFLATQYSTGLVYSPLINQYGCRRVGIVASAIFALGTSLVSVAPNIGWHIFLYSVVGGAGCGGIYIVASVAVQRSFIYNRGLATGISSLGFTAASMSGSLIMEYILSEYGLQGALLIQGGIVSQTIFFSTLLLTPNTDKTRKDATAPEVVTSPCDASSPTETVSSTPDASSKPDDVTGGVRLPDKETIKHIVRKCLDLDMLKNIPLLLCAIVYLNDMLSYFGWLSQIVGAAIDKGIPRRHAAGMLVAMGFCNLVTRVMVSVLLTFHEMNALLCVALGSVFYSASNYSTATASTHAQFIWSMVLAGCGEGIVVTLLPMVVIHVVGIDQYVGGVAVVQIGLVPGALIATPLTGWLYDINRNYKASFLLLGTSALMGFIIVSAAYILMKCKRTTS